MTCIGIFNKYSVARQSLSHWLSGATCNYKHYCDISCTDTQYVCLQYETSFANSHEAITFRKMLHDKYQVDLFLRYLQIRTIGRSSLTNHPKQDVDFWLEVQKYKVSDKREHSMPCAWVDRFLNVCHTLIENTCTVPLHVSY